MAGEDPYSIPGKYVVPGLFLLSVVTVALGFTIVRPPPGVEPSPPSQRPFGPAEQKDVDAAPLIRKGQLSDMARARRGEIAPATRPAIDD